MTSILEFAERLEELVAETVAEAAAFAASEIKRTTPANRIETRRAVFYRARKLKAVIGLRFSKRYPAANTETQRLLYRQHADLRRKLPQVIRNSINRKLQNEE